MPETVSQFDFKDLDAQSVTLLSGTKLIKLFTPDEANSVDITLIITEKKTESK